jgi:hypothetical protein
MRKLNLAKREIWFKFIELLCEKENWKPTTRFIAIAHIERLEHIVKNIRKQL